MIDGKNIEGQRDINVDIEPKMKIGYKTMILKFFYPLIVD